MALVMRPRLVCSGSVLEGPSGGLVGRRFVDLLDVVRHHMVANGNSFSSGYVWQRSWCGLRFEFAVSWS